jgi:hypothetical protein
VVGSAVIMGGVNDRQSHGILRSLRSVRFIGLYTDRMTE